MSKFLLTTLYFEVWRLLVFTAGAVAAGWLLSWVWSSIRWQGFRRNRVD